MTCRTRRPCSLRALRSEQGLASLELAVLAPVLLVLTFAPIQAMAWYHGHNIAMHAAEEAVDQARVQGASNADGTAAAESFIDRAGGLTDATVKVKRSSTQVTATVTGHVSSLIPGAHVNVSQTAHGPIARYTNP